MAYLPIFLDVSGHRCMVIGGGEVAARKVASLLEAGAKVTVVSPLLIDELSKLAGASRIEHVQREYADGDMAGATLAYAATDDAQLQQRLSVEGRARGIPVNVADVPALCTFIGPAVMRRGSLCIAVSTDGASPALAKRIIKRLERLFGPEYGLALEVLRAARRHLQANEPNIRIRAAKLTALAASRIPEYLRDGELEEVDGIVRREIGVGFDKLGLEGFGSARGKTTVEKPIVR
jgi:precorrin-2 dehydrogenase/sirohydrochlorin ferrochelatase